MTSCTIIISHYESVNFLRAAIRQIRKHCNKEVEQYIIIADQSCDKTNSKVMDEFGWSNDISVVRIKPFYSGHGIDYLVRKFDFFTTYICQLHVDAFGISNKWLSLPIKLIEEYNFSFVGQLQFISKPTDTIYPPEPFFAMAQCFNVAKTETYKEMSYEAGFTRFHERSKTDMKFKNNDWAEWAKEDYGNRGSDDDVVAFHWEDTHTLHNKLGLAISGFIAPAYGRIIDDLVFHFGSANEARGVMAQMPQQYQELTKRINENYSDELIDEMVSLAKANRPPEMHILSRNYWDGVFKQSLPPTDELNKRIEELKK